MGLKVRYFMPENSAAPFAFYYSGDLLADYTNLELIGPSVRWRHFKRFIVRKFIMRTRRQDNAISRI
jgi:hypothetical protein